MADPVPAAEPPAKKSFVKVAIGSGAGLAAGTIGMYFHAAVDQIVKPAKPLANFQVTADGLTVTCDNRASGQSGYWDFGDGSVLEPFDPNAQTVQHHYPKPGTYNVKLIVRNFLQDENDRSVSVDVGPSSTTATAADAPKVTDLKVEAIRSQVPATFHITGQLQNADEVVWFLGDKTEYSATPPKQIDRYVTFDTQGKYEIVLTALSKNHADPVVVVQTVNVERPKTDTFEAHLIITDAATNIEQKTRLSRHPVPILDAKGPTKGFSRTSHAGPNSVIIKADLDGSMPNVAKNIKIEIAADRKSVTVSGEWSVTADALAKVAGGSDLMIPVNLTEQISTPLASVRQHVSGVLDPSGKISLQMPPRPRGYANGTRTIKVDVGYSFADGKKRLLIASGDLDAHGLWQSPQLKQGMQTLVIKAAALNEQKVELTFAVVK